MHLYVHVPFCRSRCSYCGFVSYPYDRETVTDYLQALEEEIRFSGKRHPGQEVLSLYFGGGTPSLLAPCELEQILRAVRDTFCCGPDMECTLEGNPDSIGFSDYLTQLRGLGINRLSLGLQSLDKNALTVLKRRHTAEQGLETCVLAREAGFENLSVDLLWAVPGQDLTQWLFELRTVVDLGIRHLSCYALSIEPDTELDRLARSGSLVWPSEEEQAGMYLKGGKLLEKMGLKQYEISNYALRGFECRHNMGYWLGRDYLGFGPAAVSCIGARRWKNPIRFQDYLRAPAGGPVVQGEEERGVREQINELLMLRLRTSRGLSLSEYSELAARDLLFENRRVIQDFKRQGLISCEQGRLRLTPEGMLVSDSLISTFFD